MKLFPISPRPVALTGAAAIALGAVAVSPLTAQSNGRTAGDELEPTSQVAESMADFRLPIHAQQVRDLRGNVTRSIWAAGPDYKVSFHDGFTFYPVLGADAPENLPLRWRTESVTVGGQELADRVPATSHDDYRFEYDFGLVTEAYDVRVDGVEQTFVLHTAPGVAGDVVVTGLIESPLVAADVDSVHGPLSFRDAAGNDVLSYGAAYVFDAAGRRADILTSYANDRIRLTVDGDWLANATYPVTIDPLTSAKTLTGSGGVVGGCDIARNDETNEVVVSYSRASASNDYDMWVRVLDNDLNAKGTIFTDLESRYSSQRSSCAFVGGSNKWAIGFEMTFVGDTAAVAVYLHDRGNLTANSGKRVIPIPAQGEIDIAPSVGGTPGLDNGQRVFLAFRRDLSTSSTVPSNTSMVMGSLIDATAEEVIDTFRLAGGPNAGIDAEWPCVNRVNSGGTDSSWVVVWQERFNRNYSPWKIRAQRVQYDGSTVPVAMTIGSNTFNKHNIRPKIAGAERYLVSWVNAEITGTGNYRGNSGVEIRARRLDWGDTTGGSMDRIRLVASRASSTLSLQEGRPIAYDRNTDSHWALAYRDSSVGVSVMRIGYRGLVVDEELVQANAGFSTVIDMPAVCFDDDFQRFHIAYRVYSGLHQVRSRTLEAPADATTAVIGSNCGGNISARNNGLNVPMQAGSEFVQLRYEQGVPNQLVTLFASAQTGQPLPLPLSNCFLYLDPVGSDLIEAASGVTGSTGNVTFTFPADETTKGIDLNWQFVQLAPGGVRASAALSMGIR